MPEPIICPVINQTIPEIILGLVLIIGVVGSYTPQWVAIIRSKKAEGLSFVMLFVGICSCFATMINAFLLQYDRLVCCSIVETTACLVSVTGFVQLCLVFCAFFPIYILYLIFSPLRGKDSTRVPHMISIALFIVLLFFCLAVGTASGLVIREFGPNSGVTRGFAYSLGYFSLACAVAQWLPQIIQTLYTKNVGNLSIVMLGLQGPGNAAYAFYLGYSQQTSITTWVPFVVSSAQQIFLFVVCLVFCVRDRRAKKLAELARDPDKEEGALLPVATTADTSMDEEGQCSEEDQLLLKYGSDTRYSSYRTTAEV